MNGYTLPNPFQAQEQKQPEYDFDKSLDALVAKRYDANKIVGIMTSAGFDSVQVAQALNQRYEAESQQQIIDKEAMKVELQKEKDAYEQALKKKILLPYKMGNLLHLVWIRVEKLKSKDVLRLIHKLCKKAWPCLVLTL